MMKTLKFLIMIFPEASVPVCSQRDSSWICHCLCEDRSRMRREGRKEISKTIFTQLQEEEGHSSLECIQANQIFPKKSPILEEENMQVPFPELHGEFTEYVGRAEDAIIATSNYRLHIKFKESVVNVPLQLIESVECRDMFQLHVTCKDCKVVRCQFSTFEQCQEWLKRLSVVVRPPSRLEDLFSFAFHAWCMEVYAGEKEQHGELCRPGEHVTSWFKNEVERMSFDTQNAWRISDINSKFRLCPSYPQQLLVPAWITDKELENVAAFRSWKRFPAVVYRHITTGAVIARCGQPEVSWWGWRNADDEHLVQSIAKACAVDSSPHKHVQNSSYTNGSDLPDTEFESSMTNSTEVETLVIQPHKLLILDARSYAAAVANRAKGGGCECPEYYPNCEVVFMGMANIHSIRKSFQSLRFLCTQMPDPANWLSALESTKWLQHLSLLLKAALLVVNAVDRDHRPVLVHCSDGWDRTPQIVALSKLLLDPYYRTVEGFQVLVETDWLDFGHKFADRCGHGENSEDLNERCPVFLQWLDCVHQLQRQFPCSFEFNEAFLVKLVQHTYSCLFGTFLCNSGKEREDRHVQERTCSVWSLLRPANRTLRNMLYSSHSETVLHPVCHVRNLMLWSAVYLPSSSPTTPSDDSCAPYPVPGSNSEDTPLARCTKTRSFDNLPSACELGQSMAPNRRSSDPNLNEKWQDHRRSLEINIAVGPDGEGNQDQEMLSNGAGPYTDMVDSELDESLEQKSSNTELEHKASLSPESLGEEEEEAELSVAVGVAEGQMENILQEATKDEVAADQREDCFTAADVVTAVDKESGRDEKVGEEQESTKVNGSEILTKSVLNGHHPESDLTDGAKDKEATVLPPLASERAEKPDNQTGHVTQTSEEEVTQAAENSSVEEEVEHGPSESDSGEHEQPAAHRTITNGFVDTPPEGLGQDQEEMCPDCEPDHGIAEPMDKRVSVLESSTETLTEEACSRLEHVTQPPSLLSRPPCRDGRSQPPCSRRERTLDTSEHNLGRTLNGGTKRPPFGAYKSPSADLGRDGLCNGENSEGEPGGAPHWAAGNVERASLSRQMSLASCNSLILHQRCSCSQHRWCHNMMSRVSINPEQPSRSHLDDDGLTLHTDAIQQRLRQIEVGHQMEVDTLKKQVQELWSRLEIQQNTGSQRINGDMGDEVTSMTDSEYNLDPNCLSRCSTELFSEASWEQVDKQDTEVTRWYPDHLAAQCYGCESRFWLATRKHHCSGKEPVQELWNCGNVFCASCCDQKIPVPSQQLFEPSRVCKSCYGSLHLGSVPLDLEKPIAASSN
ncbi:phosphatidylinositol-3,5-bisphosphate 3-phosphatase MTMR3 isoform X1 [Cynoglossus semilaevis]|uniref:phosphatidylinositol-3,5-bisphosphate 3-phosphatase MTMR3 isoform X1 n=1 Tax=Cynoglossus semilaevis TaxID=244447 RepID=UPI0004954156|nr:myotubularin-related protein 3-like isoform X1 [Cynoglossus semilaevis]